jgi:hypothetical protein
MKKPLGSKYLILVPTVSNIAIFYILAVPVRWMSDMMTPMSKAVLMCCGVTMTGIMALAYARLHHDTDATTRACRKAPEQPIAAASAPAGPAMIPTSAEALGCQKTGVTIGGNYAADAAEAERPNA